MTDTLTALNLDVVADGEYDDLLAPAATGTAIAEISEAIAADPTEAAVPITEALAARRAVLFRRGEALAGAGIIVHLPDGSTQAHPNLNLDGIDSDGTLALISSSWPAEHVAYSPTEWTCVEIQNPTRL